MNFKKVLIKFVLYLKFHNFVSLLIMKNKPIINIDKDSGACCASSFEELYNEHYDFLLRYGLTATNNIDLVKDSIQDLFVKLYDNFNLISNIENVRSYLLRSLKNRINDQLSCYRSRNSCALDGNLFIVHEEYFGDLNEKDDETIASEARLRRKINSLTTAQREIIYLRYVEKLSYQEISILLGIEVQSAKNNKMRAMKRLRDVLKVAATIYLG